MMENKRFDDWRDELKNCNDCELYWLNTCDGVSQGDKRVCKAYKVTRNLSIPRKLNELEQNLKDLEVSLKCLALAQIVQLILIIAIYIILKG